MANDIYRINENLLATQILPPDKRLPNWENWMECLMTPAQYLNNLNTMWREGSLPQIWNSADTYTNGDLVLGWFNYTRGIFLSLKNSNTDPLGDTNSWLLIINDFIGIDERILYDGNKLILEWALNKYFGTTFRQPPNIPDIYIDDSDANYGTFYISNQPYIAGQIFNHESRGYITNITYPVLASAASTNFVIFFPSSLYVTLPGYTGTGSCDTYITNFVNNYVYDGLTYTISLY